MALTDLVLVGNHSVRVLAVNITSVANHTRYVTTELASYSSNRSLPASDLLVENTDELWVNFQSTANGSGEVKVARGFQASYEDMSKLFTETMDGYKFLSWLLYLCSVYHGLLVCVSGASLLILLIDC